LQYASLLLILLLLIVAFIILNPKDVFKKYALQTVENQWELEQTKPGSMDIIQKTVSANVTKQRLVSLFKCFQNKD